MPDCRDALGPPSDASGLGAFYAGAYHNGADVTVWDGQ